MMKLEGRCASVLRPSFAALGLAAFLLLVVASAPAAQSQRLAIAYTVRVSSIEDKLFHVTADIKNIRQPSIELSLPVWTPGWYTIENYFKNVLRFKVTDPAGSSLAHTMVRKQTWRIHTRGRNSIRVEFDYVADILALNQAKITPDWAFFTGTQLFLEIGGHRAGPCTLRLDVPAGWNVIAPLKEGSEPLTFEASDYDTLVDAPVLMGKFDSTRFEVDGKPHYFTATPAGLFSKNMTERFVTQLAKIAAAQSAIFGGLPYEKYVYFYFFTRPESNASGALEHLNSFVAFAPPPPFAIPEQMSLTAAHEFFHVWNVKRIRPAEMWPYDYGRERETPLLWVSEGFTNYYAQLSIYRVGIADRSAFLDSVADAIGGVENNEARFYISPAESSVSTWVGYDTPVTFGISYYTQGQNLGALLDLSMRHDTRGVAGLDDVMRALYIEHYKRGRGFTSDNLLAIVNRITKRDYADFFKRYVWGIETPPYDTILGYAGYTLSKTVQPVPSLGIDVSMTPEGSVVTAVRSGSSAAQAGVTEGDLVLSIDGVEARRGLQHVRRQLVNRIGRSVPVVLKRGADPETIAMEVKARQVTQYRIVEAPSPSPEMLKVRESWMARPQ
jgi:predicted metalloprotease with PDZ domain